MADLERIIIWHGNPDNKQPALFIPRKTCKLGSLHPPCWDESLGKTAFRELFTAWAGFPLEYGKMFVWNPKIFLRDKFLAVQAGSRPWQWGLRAGHSPCGCHHPPVSRWQGLISCPGKSQHCLQDCSWNWCEKGTDKVKPHHHPALLRYLSSVTYFPVLFCLLKHLLSQQENYFYFFLLLSRSSSGLPLFLLSPTHYCSTLASDYFNHQSLLPVLSYTLD